MNFMPASLATDVGSTTTNFFLANSGVTALAATIAGILLAFLIFEILIDNVRGKHEQTTQQ